MNLIQSKLKKYYNEYLNNFQLSKTNNNIIYEHIKNKINNYNIILNSSNIKSFNDTVINELYNKITFNSKNKEFVFIDIINRIIKSFYDKAYFLLKYQLLNHIKLSFYDNQLIDDIKNNNYWYDNLIVINYKEKIENEFELYLKSDQFIYKTFVYENCLGDNKIKLPADIILNIIDKYYEAIKSYYAKLAKKLKATKPKYLDCTERFNLFYYPSSFKIIDNKIRLTIGKHIADNYNNFHENKLYKISNRKYCNSNNIINKIKNIKNKKNYLKIADGYVNKINLIDANYLNLKLPRILYNQKIKLIQIKSYGNYFTIYVSYEEIIEPINNIKTEITSNNSISIDTGIKNLMTIYNPTGNQYIIKGGKIKAINEFYNKKIAELQSINNKANKISKFNRLYSLLNERKNKINGEINQLIDILLQTYENKQYFIVGYNESWKNKVNLGRKTNRIFYNIPYSRIIMKLKEKLTANGKELIINEESYTSKCDSLNLEHLGKNNNYTGERIYRGLFISKTGKALNADLNGAINIMRKVIDLEKIVGNKLFNPTILSA